MEPGLTEARPITLVRWRAVLRGLRPGPGVGPSGARIDPKRRVGGGVLSGGPLHGPPNNPVTGGLRK